MTYIFNKEKQCLDKNITLKGYVIKRFLYYLFRVIEAETANLLPKILTSRVKRTTNRYARPILAKYAQTQNRAKTFRLNTISKAIKYSFEKQTIIGSETASCLSLTFTTGCRLADALNIDIKDIKPLKNKYGKFVKIHLQNSKNNLLGIKAEQLTFKTDPTNIIKLDEDLKTYLSRVEITRDKLFDQENSQSAKIK